MSKVGFWRELKQDARDINIQSNRLGKIGRPWFIFPDGNGPRGAFANFTDLAPNLRSRDVVVIGGVLREQAIAPLDVYDVTIIGAANLPRQATTATGGVPSAGTPTGGGACWLPPTTPVAGQALLEVRAAGWSFENIEFSPANASAAVRLSRSAVIDTLDASHASFLGCYFGGNGGTTQKGIEDNGGCGHVYVEECRFDNLGNTAILSLNTAAAIALGWLIARNRFQQNLNDVKMSLSYAMIEWNNFMTAGAGSTNKVVQTNFIAAQGGNNHVGHNVFTNTGAQIANASGYNGAASDTWYDNFTSDTADYGVPA